MGRGSIQKLGEEGMLNRHPQLSTTVITNSGTQHGA